MSFEPLACSLDAPTPSLGNEYPVMVSTVLGFLVCFFVAGGEGVDGPASQVHPSFYTISRLSLQEQNSSTADESQLSTRVAYRDTVPTEYIRAPSTYYSFLRFLDDSASADRSFSRAVVRRQLNALQVVLADSTVDALGIQDGMETGRSNALSPGAGQHIERWWRWKDPYPATKANERLQEHLKRVSYAFQRYSRRDEEYRLDDRGRVYVRYGPPNRSRDLRRGEFWTYGFQTAAEFLFVCERDDGCALGQPVELIPPRLRYGYGPTDRGTRKAIRSLSFLETIYEQLAHHRSRYGTTYSDLSMYNEQIRQRLNDTAAPMTVRPHSFVSQKTAEITQEEVQARKRREKVVSQTRSRVGEELGTLPVAARWMRTLSEDGSTEVELAWSVSRSDLRPSGDQIGVLRETDRKQSRYLLSTSLVRFSGAYERRSIDKRYLTAPTGGEGGMLKPRYETFLLGNAPNVALQVDLAWASVEDESSSIRPQARLKVGTSRADSLRPLNSDPSRLEMSDLKPVLMRSDSVSIKEAPAYPFRKLAQTPSLGLRFEVYHLSKNKDRTRYTVEYEVRRRTDRGGFARLLRGNDEERTSVESRLEGRKARAEEAILLNTTSWSRDESQEIQVVVRVTDQHTSQDVERSIAFTLPPSSE